MYINNYEIVIMIVISIFSLILLFMVIVGIVEFRKSNKEFEAILREKQRMNNQLRK